jgi:hypothetical protein
MTDDERDLPIKRADDIIYCNFTLELGKVYRR